MLVLEYYVYEHWRTDLNRPFYVGKGYGPRMRRFHARNMHYAAIVAKTGRPIVKIVAARLSEGDAHALERERIALWRSAGLQLANYTDGGEGMSGHRFSEASRAKMSAAKKKASRFLRSTEQTSPPDTSGASAPTPRERICRQRRSDENHRPKKHERGSPKPLKHGGQPKREPRRRRRVKDVGCPMRGALKCQKPQNANGPKDASGRSSDCECSC